MKLNPKQSNELLTKITAQKPLPLCPICGCQTFHVNDTVYNLTECTSKAQTIGRGVKFIPVISASCDKCGYMIFFNGLINGVITEKDLDDYVEQ